MVPFKRLTQGEKPTIARIVSNMDTPISPALLLQWMEQEDSYYAIIENLLIFRRQEGHQFIYSIPYGEGPLRYALMQMLEASNVMGCKCVITGIGEDYISDIKSAMPGHFSFEQDENGTYTATAIQNYSHSVFNNNESMVPPPTGESFK